MCKGDMNDIISYHTKYESYFGDVKMLQKFKETTLIQELGKLGETNTLAATRPATTAR